MAKVTMIQKPKPDIDIRLSWDEAELLRDVVGDYEFTTFTSGLYESLRSLLSEG